MRSILLLGVLTQVILENDWVAITDFQTDAWCTTAHDRVSGARVTDCRYAGDTGSTDNKPCGSDRSVSRQVRKIGTKEVEVVECPNPSRYVEKWRADIGSEALDDGCSLSELLKSYTVPSACERERVFAVKLTGDGRHEFRLVECSREQFDRALEYVLAVSEGAGPTPIEEQSAPTRPIDKANLPTIGKGVTLASLISDYGPPDSVWPRYPDAFSLVYPVVDGSGQAVIHFNKERQTVGAALVCW